MSPILGIVASSNFQRVTSSYESIATTTLATATGTITFSSIPATYTHLQIRLFAFSSLTGTTPSSQYLQLNGDGGGNYSSHLLIGDGASATASSSTSATVMYLGYNAPTGYTSVGAASIIDILDYTNTSKYKTLRCLNGVDGNGSGKVDLSSGNWRSTSAVTSITIGALGYNMNQYTSAALYGIKGA
tara:strand:+ start:4427 stop:4987 length:561 start_codon:yes stop_codon:yes gene_type:complete